MVILISILTVILFASPGWATTYYVSNTSLHGYSVGNDSHTCTQAQSTATPKLTINKTASSGLGCLASGDTLIINDGTYDNDPITNPPGGSASAYTIIKGEPSGNRPLLRPTMGGGAYTNRGFQCTLGAACSYIHVEYLEIYRAYNSVNMVGTGTTYPAYVEFVNNKFCHTIHTNYNGYFSKTEPIGGPYIIRNNEFCFTGEFYTDTGNSLPYTPRHNTIYGVGNNSLIEGNVFHDLSNGIGVWSNPSIQINLTARNNSFYNIGREDINPWMRDTVAGTVTGTYSAIHVSVPGGGHHIYGNVMWDSCNTVANVVNRCGGFRNGWTGYGSGPGGTLADIYNNTVVNLFDSNAACVGAYQPGGSTQVPTMNVKNNICPAGHPPYFCPGCLGSMSNNFTGDPGFTNAPAQDFTLTALSPAIDFGTPFDGYTYSGAAPDAGAFEYTQSAPTGGTFSQASHVFQKIYTTNIGISQNLSFTNGIQNVMDGGAVAIVFQINCDNVSPCQNSSFALRTSTDGITYTLVPDTAGANGVYFWGTSTETWLNNGGSGSSLTGLVPNTSGSTQLTSSDLPTITLGQNTSITLRYLVRFAPGFAGQARYFKLYQQTGSALNGTYTPSTGAMVNIVSAQASMGF